MFIDPGVVQLITAYVCKVALDAENNVRLLRGVKVLWSPGRLAADSGRDAAVSLANLVDGAPADLDDAAGSDDTFRSFDATAREARLEAVQRLADERAAAAEELQVRRLQLAIGKQQAEASLMQRIRDAAEVVAGGEIVVQPIVVIGRGGGPGGWGGRGHAPTASPAALAHMLSHTFLTLTVNEFLTSQLCPACHTKVGAPGGGDMLATRDRVCEDADCPRSGLCINRDVMACLNIAVVAVCMLISGQRPDEYTRAKGEDENKGGKVRRACRACAASSLRSRACLCPLAEAQGLQCSWRPSEIQGACDARLCARGIR